MYCSKNFKTKKALKEAVQAWNDYQAAASARPLSAIMAGDFAPEAVTLYAPGIGQPVENGQETCCGPWFPAAHKWYAQVEVRNGIVVKVK